MSFFLLNFSFSSIENDARIPQTTTESPEDLILHLPFDEGSGNVAYDQSDNENHGTISNAIWIEGVKGTALEFDQGDWVNCGKDASFDVTFFTIEAWIYVYSATGNRHQILAKFENESRVLDDSYIFELSTDSQRLVLTLSREGEPHWNECYSSERIAFNKWIFVAGTYDGTHVRLFINGGEVGASQVSIQTRKTSAPVVIGNHYDDSGNFNGRIDEIRMYNRALTFEEIIEDYNQLKNPQELPSNVIGGMVILSMLLLIFTLTIRNQRRRLH